VLWVNVHLSALIGLAVLGLYVLIAALRWLNARRTCGDAVQDASRGPDERKHPPLRGEERTKAALRHVAGVGVLSFLALSVNPRGPAWPLRAYELALTAEADLAAAGGRASSLERLQELGLEVLLLAERIDQWVMGYVESFEGKRFKDATRGGLELGGLASDADQRQRDAELKESKGLLKRIKDALGERVTEVRVSERLKESPACLVLGEHDLTEHMRRILVAAGQQAPAARPVLEVNVAHPLVKYLESRSDPAQFTELAQLTRGSRS